MFARMKEAFGALPPDGNVFMVLTLDQNGTYSEKRWANADEANAALSKQSRNFVKRLRRYCLQRGWSDFRNRWVATVEAHRSGWPHMNYIIHCPELAAELAADYAQRVKRTSHRGATLLEGDLLTMAMATGWGVQSTAERGRDADALVGYITKLAGRADATVGELAKLSQAPVAARKGFRRLRAGVGFLPPKRKNPDYTGTLIRRIPDQRRAAFGAVPLVRLKDPQARAVSELLPEVEEDRMAREWRHRQPLALHEERPPLPDREWFQLRGGRYVRSVAPLGDGEAAALGHQPDAARGRLVLPTDQRAPPDAPAPHSEQVQRFEQVQLVLIHTEPVFELRRAHSHVDAEHARRVLERSKLRD
jgi:hypothetical protein